MSCSDLSAWYLRHRIAILDVGTTVFRRGWNEVVPPGYETDVCLRRLRRAGLVRRIGRGLYLVIDPVRETPAIAIASGVFSEVPHYVTTDAALAQQGLIDQPIARLTIVLPRARRPLRVDQVTLIRPVTLSEQRIRAADAYDTTIEGFAIRVASREQAVVDALVEPKWMVHGDLLAEVLAAFTDDEVDRTASGVLSRTMAAAQRLGYLLEEAGRSLPAALAELRPVRAVQLRPQTRTRGPYSTRWRVYG
jgi:predicted transcriptional regulator of viral defense system